MRRALNRWSRHGAIWPIRCIQLKDLTTEVIHDNA